MRWQGRCKMPVPPSKGEPNTGSHALQRCEMHPPTPRHQGSQSLQSSQGPQFLEQAGGGAQQLLMATQVLVHVHVHLQGSRQAAMPGHAIVSPAGARPHQSPDRRAGDQAAVPSTLSSLWAWPAVRLTTVTCCPVQGKAASRPWRGASAHPPTCTVALPPGWSDSLMRTIWERTISGSSGGVGSL